MGIALGIDIGTSSTKTVAINEGGELLAAASAGYPLSEPHPGWVEQDPADWWRAVCNTTRDIVRQLGELSPPRRAAEIQGISLSGQMNGAVFVDAGGRPLRPCPLWLDHRCQRECDDANDIAGDLLRKHAIHVLNPINVLAKILWLRVHEPSVYEATDCVLMPKDWVRHRLTGEIAADVSDGSVTAALDVYQRDWSQPILEALSVPAHLFPPLLESVEVAGKLTVEAARETALPAGVPVCAGGGDMACMAVGSGVIRPGVVSMGIGTAGHATSYAESVSDAAFNQLWPMCHAVPGAYFWLGCSYTCGASFSWVRDLFGEDYDELTTHAAQAPPGSEGLFFLPWLEGAATPHPDSNARGGWLGLSLRHRKAHLVRAVMEGVAFELRQALECFHALNLPINEIRIGEGGSRSPLWRQILADVFGRDARLMEVEDASAVGAAIIAGVSAGVWPSFQEACDRVIILSETVSCDPSRVEIYERAFQRYRGLYPALREWFGTGATDA